MQEVHCRHLEHHTLPGMQPLASPAPQGQGSQQNGNVTAKENLHAKQHGTLGSPELNKRGPLEAGLYSYNWNLPNVMNRTSLPPSDASKPRPMTFTMDLRAEHRSELAECMKWGAECMKWLRLGLQQRSHGGGGNCQTQRAPARLAAGTVRERLRSHKEA